MSNCLSNEQNETSTKQSVQEVLDELDQKGFESLQKVLTENPLATDMLANTMLGNSPASSDKNEQQMKKLGDSLMSIMTDGAKEFEKKTGRPMTYAEMRYAYG